MKPQTVPFPYELRPSTIFGTIHRPVAAVALYSWRLKHWIVCPMVVDTGADYCILPSRIALRLGIELAQCERFFALGIGGKETVFLHRGVRVRLGPWEWTVSVGVVERDDLPPLLGRYQCLDAFDLRLCNFVTTFSPRPRSATPH